MNDYDRVWRAAQRLRLALKQVGGIPQGLTSGHLAAIFASLPADDLQSIASDLRSLATQKREQGDQ